MNTIVINGRFLVRPTTGVERFATEAVKALDRLIGRRRIDAAKYAFTLVHPPAPESGRRPIEFKHIGLQQAGRWTGHLWEQGELSRYAGKRSWLLSLCNTGPMLAKRHIAVIHDAAVYARPDNYSAAFRTGYRAMYAMLAKRAARIATVSGFSRQELARYLRIPPAHMPVIREGHEHLSSILPAEDAPGRLGLRSGQYVLAVGSLSANKNLSVCAGALERLGDSGLQLAVTGRLNGRVFRPVDLPDGGNIRQLGYVSDAELRSLYAHALCLVFPSFYEGFGLPPLEAMACGCPVIVSDRAALPELCGDAALYCDPDRPQSVAGHIRSLQNDAALRAELRAKGLARAAAYSWDQCAEDLMQVIDEVISG